YTMVAYDATAVLYAALDRAIRDAGGHLPARAKVTAELAQTSGLAGATEALGFDAAGDTTNRIVTVFEAAGADPRASWKLVDAVDYTTRLPYLSRPQAEAGLNFVLSWWALRVDS